MKDSEYKDLLTNQKREMQIVMIKSSHPVYTDFNFEKYSDQKVEEMYKVLVKDQMSGRNTEVQTKV